MIVTEEKETVAIADAVTEAVKVGVAVLLPTSAPQSVQRETGVKAKARLISFRFCYPPMYLRLAGFQIKTSFLRNI